MAISHLRFGIINILVFLLLPSAVAGGHNSTRALFSCSQPCSFHTSIQSCHDTSLSCLGWSCLWLHGKCVEEKMWSGFTEVGQTHVIRAKGETRHAPKIIAEREMELLFYPSQVTTTPTSKDAFGLEKGAAVHVRPTSGANWPAGYPMKSNILVHPDTEYYLPPSIQNVDIVIDLGAQYVIQDVATTLWYYSRVKKIEILLHVDDGKKYHHGPPSASNWINAQKTASGLGSINRRIVIPVNHVHARYVMIRLHGGHFGDNGDYSRAWGLRFIEVAGTVDENNLKFGLEKGSVVRVQPALGATWPAGNSAYPMEPKILVHRDTEYYLPPSIQNVDIFIDLGAEHIVQGVATTLWYYSRVKKIEILLHADGKWSHWMRVKKTASGLGSINRRVVIPVSNVRARYVMVRLRGGHFGDNGDYSHQWGLRFIEVAGKHDAVSIRRSNLEKGAVVHVRPTLGAQWPAGYPMKSNILVHPGSEYYLPPSIQNVDIVLDLGAQRLVQGVATTLWYYSRVKKIEILLHVDDGKKHHHGPPPESNWINVEKKASGLGSINRRIVIPVHNVRARYVMVRLHGGHFGDNGDYSHKWGLRFIEVTGQLDGNKQSGGDNWENTFGGIGFLPPQNAIVTVDAFNAYGGALGSLKARNNANQRPLLEQALTDGKKLAPYSSKEGKDMWSATIPWNWVREGTRLVFSVVNENDDIISHTLTLHSLAQFSEHTLYRVKVAIFGDKNDVKALDPFTGHAKRIASGMFSIMPVASLHWVDPEVWHLPYLVIQTSKGPRLVRSEAQRRKALADAGDKDKAGLEPRWEVLKNHISFRHSHANAGRGLTITAWGGKDSSPYAAHTSIAMGWALTKDNPKGNGLVWDHLGYWEAWSAAAWTGWTAMVAGDECGNTLSHEIGHSQTMSHFVSGSAKHWGIDDEYPEDGTNLATHPWGYDTVSRRFRTWYSHETPTRGKRDPMGGGESPNKEICFPQYTGFHALKSQNWGKNSPLLLDSSTSSVLEDGAYYYSEGRKMYEPIDDGDIPKKVGPYGMPPEKIGIPVITVMGTIGTLPEVNQIYPVLRSSWGNTFKLADPLDGKLQDVYKGAAYVIEVSYSNGRTRQGLIAAKRVTKHTDFFVFSFNIATQDKPVQIALYRYNTDSYPSLKKNSAKTLLFTRSVNLPSDPLAGIAATTKVGRGWLGESGDIFIEDICTSVKSCQKEATTLMWRDEKARDIRYKALTSFQNYDSKSSSISVTVKSDSGQQYQVTLLVSRFVSDGKHLKPLLSAPVPAPADGTHGIKVWLPYDLNPNLPYGNYKGVLIPIAQATRLGKVFTTLRVNINISVKKATNLVDLSNGKSFTSKLFKPRGSSSAYFLLTNEEYGPTRQVWWGGSHSTLKIPLISFNCNKKEVTAVLIGQQKTDCSSYLWQMNAGRGADECGNHLVLKMDDKSANPWIENADFKGCLFQTHQVRPVTVNAFAWHSNEGKLGTMNLDIRFQM